MSMMGRVVILGSGPGSNHQAPKSRGTVACSFSFWLCPEVSAGAIKTTSARQQPDRIMRLMIVLLFICVSPLLRVWVWVPSKNFFGASTVDIIRDVSFDFGPHLISCASRISFARSEKFGIGSEKSGNAFTAVYPSASQLPIGEGENSRRIGSADFFF